MTAAVIVAGVKMVPTWAPAYLTHLCCAELPQPGWLRRGGITCGVLDLISCCKLLKRVQKIQNKTKNVFAALPHPPTMCSNFLPLIRNFPYCHIPKITFLCFFCLFFCLFDKSDFVNKKKDTFLFKRRLRPKNEKKKITFATRKGKKKRKVTIYSSTRRGSECLIWIKGRKRQYWESDAFWLWCSQEIVWIPVRGSWCLPSIPGGLFCHRLCAARHGSGRRQRVGQPSPTAVLLRSGTRSSPSQYENKFSALFRN